MNRSVAASRGPLAVVLKTVRCFNAAAFAALAFYYCAAYCLAPQPGQALQLIPLAPPSPPSPPSH
jgi:hypothetical protein